MPEGIRCNTVFLPPITSVWPALCPPWKRTTPCAWSVSQSTTLPLPSSPHWVPITTTFLAITDSSNQNHAVHETHEIHENFQRDVRVFRGLKFSKPNGHGEQPPLIMKLAMPVPLTSILSRKRARRRTNR